ncbi:DUF899 family protein [Billgrantia sp. C5P2]|uniref:DUF899 family protein n=1 Tax=Billgrantia sp. C5P2 TaxID=3436239 RepID=UPI0040593BCE
MTEQQREENIEYNYRREPASQLRDNEQSVTEIPSRSIPEGDTDGLWGMYQWLDRAPGGRNETGIWWRRHDEYDKR